MTSSSPSKNSSSCPRCGHTFGCQLSTQGQCVCFSITLSPQTLSKLRQQYEGCLCLQCLQELALTPKQT